MSLLSPLQVLIVDDCLEDRMICRRFLQQDPYYNYHFLECETGTDAISICQKRAPDVILLDLGLPDQEGLECLLDLRQQFQASQSTIIILSGKEDRETAVQAMKSGAQDYLTKDKLTPDFLQRSIHAAVEQMVLAQKLELSREKQRLLTTISLRIRQSLEIDKILQASVKEIRHFLQADRVLVYKFSADMTGTIVAESVLTGLTPALGSHIEDTCFQSGAGTAYYHGKMRAINNIEQAGLTECHIQLLQQFEVKANLVVPILVNAQLWGLLIAHQCLAPRQWQADELDLLNQIAVQIAIAIQQANSYNQLQTELAERRRITEELNQQKQQLQLITESIPAAIIQVDQERRYQFVNQTYLSWLNLSREEILGKYVQQILGPITYQRIQPALDQVLQGNPVHLENKIEFCAGVSRDIEAQLIPQVNQSRQVEGYYAFMIDVSERKLAESALRVSEERFRSIFEQAAVGINYAALTGEFIRVNQQFCKITGYSQAELQALTYQDITHPDDLREDDEFVKHLLAGEIQTYALEKRYLRKDGSIIWVNITVSLKRDQASLPEYFITVVEDITARKQAETALFQLNQELELRVAQRTIDLQEREAQLQLTNTELAHATRLKDEFLASMSHELRTPLNAILGMAEGLQDEVFGNLNELQLRAISTIEKAGAHLLELINDILDLSKIEAGKLEIDLSEVLIPNLCHNALTFIQPMAAQKSICLLINIAADTGKIWADNRRLQQALMNLLNNAVKFTPEAGTVSLNVKRKHNCINFIITDTGIGIAPENMSQLFQPFVQIDSRLSRQYAGTGLGLVLVHRIAELHGGSVTVQSEVGRGSCFTLQIPDRPHPTPPLPQTPTDTLETSLADSPQKTRLPLILLAEDNEANVETLFAYLANHGYEILVAQNGQEAIDLTLAHHPNLILMDIQMPQVDGLEAIKQLRATRDFATVPIIALTALAMVGDRERCLAAGATEYMTKPVALRQLLATIQKLLKNSI